MKKIFRIALTQTKSIHNSITTEIYSSSNQSNIVEDIRSKNLEHHIQLISEAKRMKSNLVCLGEIFTCPYFPLHKSEIWYLFAEDYISGPTISKLKKIASELGIVIIAPIYEFDSISKNRYSTAIVINDDGHILGKYRKCHIPNGKNEISPFYERFYFNRSDGRLNNNSEFNLSKSRFFPVFKTKYCNLGVILCYDRHFEGVISTLSNNGAELILCPSVTFGQQSERLWHKEFVVDSHRNNVFIGGLNRKGKENPWNVEFFGSSYITGPSGKLRNISKNPELVISDIELNSLNTNLTGWELKTDKRPLIYF